MRSIDMRKEIQPREKERQQLYLKILVSIVLFITTNVLNTVKLNAQLITLPKKTDTKPAPAPKKTNTPSVKPKTINKIKEDEEDKPVVENNQCYLIIGANKGSTITVFLNDTLVGKIKAGSNRRIPVEAGEYFIRLEDKEEFVLDTIINVPDLTIEKNVSEANKLFRVNFPEVDYAAIEAERLRIKREEEDRIRKENEAAEAERLRIKIEEEERIRKENEAVLIEFEQSMNPLFDVYNSLSTELQKDIRESRQGKKEWNEIPIKLYSEKINENKAKLDQLLTTYQQKAAEFNMNDRRTNYLRDLQRNYEKNTKDIEAQLLFVKEVETGKKAVSEQILIALQRNRVNDLPFFINSTNIEEPIANGQLPIVYTTKNNLHAEVLAWLLKQGASPNFYGNRIQDSISLYLTPLAQACINNNIEQAELLIKAGGQLYPPSILKVLKEVHNKFFLEKAKFSEQIVALLKKNEYDLDDGTTKFYKAAAKLDSTLVFVKGGAFKMGCTFPNTDECFAPEKPSIDVEVNHFMVSKFEVTQELWTLFMEENPSFYDKCAQCPVEQVSFEMIQEFLTKLNRFSNKKYRLPTEAEWELAARGGMQFIQKNNRFPGTNIESELGEYALFVANAGGKTSPVGSKKPNELGIFDMAGNVEEICSDWYLDSYYKSVQGLLKNPQGPSSGSQKVIRGGSITNTDKGLRLSRRAGILPQNIKNNLGFRLVTSDIDSIYLAAPPPVVEEKKEPEVKKEPETNNDVDFNDESKPTFIGGQKAWMEFLRSNLKTDILYEKDAPSGEYIIELKFKVDVQGRVKSPVALNKPGYGFENEGLRLLRISPKWKPATKDGKPIEAETEIKIKVKHQKAG